MTQDTTYMKKGEYYVVYTYSIKGAGLSFGFKAFEFTVSSKVTFQQMNDLLIKQTNKEMGKEYGGKCSSILMNLIKIK